MEQTLAASPARKTAVRKVWARLVPLLFLIVFASFLDRSNLSYAALGMNDALGLTSSMFGLAAGIFFLGEVVFAVPSSIAARKIGVHIWLPLLMVLWGACVALMACVRSANELNILRFALGAAEAGVIPAIMASVSLWLPPDQRAKAITVIMASGAVATIVGAPLSAALNDFHGLGGLDGWRWIYLGEGALTVVVGGLLFWGIPSGPERARWLKDGERVALMSAVASAAATVGEKRAWTARSVLYMSFAGALGLCVAGATAAMIFWMPKVAEETLGFSLREIGRTMAPTFALGIVGSFLVSAYSDRSGRRYAIVAALGAVAAAALIAPILAGAAIAFYAMMTAFLIVRCVGGVFMAALSQDMRGVAAAHGFGIVAVTSAIGQFGGSWIFGVIRDETGDFGVGLSVVAGLIVLSVCCALVLALLRKGAGDSRPSLAGGPVVAQ